MADRTQIEILNGLASNASQLDNVSAQLNNATADLADIVAILRNGARSSQANYRNFNQQYQDRWGYNSNYGNNSDFNNLRNRGMGNGSMFGRNSMRNAQKGFLDSFEDAILSEFLGPDFRRNINKVANDFAKQLGTTVEGIPGKVGDMLGKRALNSFKSSRFGRQITPALNNFTGQASNIIQNRGANAVAKFVNGESLSAVTGELSAMGGELLGAGRTLISSSIEASGGVIRFTAGLAGGLITLKLFDAALGAASLTIQAVVKMMGELTKAGNRDVTSRSENLKKAKTRMEADYKTLIEQPFKILEAAAQNLYNSWNTNLGTVAATQGYNKSDVQDLMAAFAQRIRDEGLSKYVSGADMFDNLAQVLKSGMSGRIAEEFAYQATVLNKAVPTQDFFQYASTYASLAANAVRQGKSQDAAIQEANESMQSFANGLLYASRELTGGFTTGLQNASAIYEESAKIAQAARSENVSAISSVLLATQSYVGAIAPDLASGLTSNIYKILTGGNSADIVALRSLAGINASNTEFLQAFASNPQRVFSTLFENLGKMYSDSSAAYMEKAEGYAQLFGLSSEAFQRVDFAGLADAIRNMNMSSSSLSENMELLKEGQTTTTAEQLKAQQINQYMIEEGLAYVIDNEAAQLIQQHMWDEQMNRELMENEYAVNLKGTAAEALELIQTGVNGILNIINPVAWVKKIANVVNTAQAGNAMDADVKQLLELGKVGSGNAQMLYKLTTRNQDLNLTRSLVELMGGTSLYAEQAADLDWWATYGNLGYNTSAISPATALAQSILNSSTGLSTSGSINSPSSKYTWGAISKSTGLAASTLLQGLAGNRLTSAISDVTTESGSSAASASAAAAKASIDAMLKDSYLLEDYVKKGKTYEEWAASASQFGIADLDSALESAGYNALDVQKYFQNKETAYGAEEAHNIRVEEKLFRDTGVQFWTTDFPNDYRDPLFTYMETIIQNQEDWKTYYTDEWLNKSWPAWQTFYQDQWLNKSWPSWQDYYKTEWLNKSWPAWQDYYKTEWLDKGWPAFVSLSGSDGLFNKFYNEFMNYFVRHTYYDATSGYKYSDVETIQNAAKAQERGDTVYALAEMLTKNLVDLKDPTMQTNALLAQILVVVNAIMNQTQDTTSSNSSSSLIETLAGLGLGITSSGSSNNSTVV